MRAIPTPKPLKLPARWASSSSSRKKAIVAMIKKSDRSTYFSKHRSWNSLKKWLSRSSNQKCWYCECKSPRAPFDVDHFRPKSGITVDGAALSGHAGYYSLAYDWKNFRLSCQRCNRPEKAEDGTLCGKANEFPLRHESRRCRTQSASLKSEEPRFLDPRKASDCDLLAHLASGEIEPTELQGTWNHMRARYTIDRLGFNKWNVPEVKRKPWQSLDLLIQVAGNRPDVVNQLRNYLSDDQEYLSFFRAAISTHRDKAWVKSLL